jgi:hypothetical protein
MLNSGKSGNSGKSDIIELSIILNNKTISISQKNNSVIETFNTIYNNKKKLINLSKNTKFNSIVFIKIIENASYSFNFNILMKILNEGVSFFTDFEVSAIIIKRIEKWTKGLGKNSYTWNNLINKPDYGLELFINRFWPYYNVKNNDWKTAAVAALGTSSDGDYPMVLDNLTTDILLNNKQGNMKLSEIIELKELTKDFKEEYNISQQHNNFLGYSVLDPTKYPDINDILSKVGIIIKLNLHMIAFECLVRLMITPAVCHIIKYDKFWVYINLICVQNTYKNIFLHYFYYAIYILNHEDLTMFSKIKRNYRIIFNHDETINMPGFNNCHINVNPYIQQLTGSNYIFTQMPFYLKCNRRFNTKQTFEDRLFLATGGALHNINLSKYKAAVSGSILIPCVCYNELEEKFINIRFNTSRNTDNMIIMSNTNNYSNKDLYTHLGKIYKLNESDKNFMSYLEYYYPSYYSLKDNDYIKNVLTETEIISEPDINEISDDDDDDDDSISNERPKIEQYNLLSDIDISITCDNYDLFEKLSKKLANEIIKNCKHIGDVWIKKVFTASSFKFKLYGPGLIRPIDLFRISYGPDKMVKKFHCPIVRSWYDGVNIPSFKLNQICSNQLSRIELNRSTHLMNNTLEYETSETNNYTISESEHIESDSNSNLELNNSGELMVDDNIYYNGYNSLISCVMTTLSGINNNYKWFFNSKPCIEVILKYAQRGYTTIINNKEKEALLIYMKGSDRWNNYISENIDIYGQVSSEHIFFQPCLYNCGIRYNLRKFTLNEISTYSKTMHVGIHKSISEYKIDLSIKTNNQLNIPDMIKFNSFKEYIEDNNDDEFSDADEF